MFNTCVFFPCSVMEVRFSENARVYKTENENFYFTVSIRVKFRVLELVADYCDIFVVVASTHLYPCIIFQVIINPDWSDMVILAQSDRDGKSQGLYAVYRKPQEGSAVPLEQRPITAHVEADRQHIENIVNFSCCYLWASMLDSTPPQPHINLL